MLRVLEADANPVMAVLRPTGTVSGPAAAWLDRYDTDRPHSALGYVTPKAYREQLAA